jgi:PHD/YefM family antitoxin component YafN of YafNO toxin-antitoxin module
MSCTAEQFVLAFEEAFDRMMEQEQIEELLPVARAMAAGTK